jgi:hypothetical protein
VSELQAAADTQLASVRETIQREQLELEVRQGGREGGGDRRRRVRGTQCS